MRSISSKLILAILSIGVISVLIIAVTAVWSTRAEFIRFLDDQTRTQIVERLLEYHQTYGSWERVDSIFVYADGPGQGMGPQRRRQPFALTDQNGRVIVPGGIYHKGEQLSRAALRQGIPITDEGEVIGVLIPVQTPFEGQPRELEFIQRINRLLLYGALIGAVDRFRQREQSLRAQLNDLEIRHRVSEAQRRQIEAVLHSLRDGVIVTDAFGEQREARHPRLAPGPQAGAEPAGEREEHADVLQEVEPGDVGPEAAERGAALFGRQPVRQHGVAQRERDEQRQPAACARPAHFVRFCAMKRARLESDAKITVLSW